MYYIAIVYKTRSRVIVLYNLQTYLWTKLQFPLMFMVRQEISIFYFVFVVDKEGKLDKTRSIAIHEKQKIICRTINYRGNYKNTV